MGIKLLKIYHVPVPLSHVPATEVRASTFCDEEAPASVPVGNGALLDQLEVCLKFETGTFWTCRLTMDERATVPEEEVVTLVKLASERKVGVTGLDWPAYVVHHKKYTAAVEFLQRLSVP
eukprot:3390251-Amphidinium_carterae.2